MDVRKYARRTPGSAGPYSKRTSYSVPESPSKTLENNTSPEKRTEAPVCAKDIVNEVRTTSKD